MTPRVANLDARGMHGWQGLCRGPLDMAMETNDLKA